MLGASFGELSLSAVSVWLLVCGFLALGVRALAKPPRNLPPGPVPEPLIGNVRQIPSSYSWLTYTSLAEKYGMFLSRSRAIAVGGVLSPPTHRRCPLPLRQ